MDKQSIKNKKRKDKLHRDLKSFGFRYPKGVEDKLSEIIDKKADGKKLNPISLSKKLLSLAPEYKAKANISVLLSILGEISIFATYFFGAFTAQQIINIFLGKESISIYKYGGLTFLFVIIYFLLTGISSYLSHTTAFHILDSLRKVEFEKLQKISLGYLVDQSVGRIKVMMQEKVQNLEDWVAHLYPELPGKIVHPIFATIVLFIVDWRIGLSIFAPVPIAYLGSIIMMDRYEARGSVFMSSYAYLAEKTIEFVRGIPVIKAFLQEDKTFKKFKEAVDFYHDTTLDWYHKTWLSMSVVMAAVMTPLIVTLPLAVHLFYSNQIEVWGLLLSVILPLSILPQAFVIGQSLELFQISTESVYEIFEFLESKEQIRPKTMEEKFDYNKGIEFKNVSFSYIEGVKVLKDISFKAKPDQITAFVGPSGSGKSTIAKLIAGFWDNDSGEILIEGIENKNLPFEDLMGEIAYVSQDNFLFNKSIRENLLIAKPEATEDEIIKSAKLASCHDFIMNLPMGYDTIVGEAGGKLSGGERQRITIARAILKDANIILLDEATAYTDPENESIIQNAISKLVKGKTLIVVAHRLHTIENADKILVIDKGRIEDRGTHSELLKNSALYNRLWKKYTGGKINV